MLFWKVIGILWFGYLVGSIPTSVWVGKLFFNIDVRDHGSGNAGATNTIRVLGLKPGIPVLLIDAFKGWFVVWFAGQTSLFDSGSETMINFQLAMGVSAVLGHVFPVFAGFRGGKGVATLFGVVIALFPIAFLLVAVIFMLIFILTKYVSLGSIIGAVCFPFIVIFVSKINAPSLIMFSIIISLFIPYTHLNNIKRLLKGEETKMKLFQHKDKNHAKENDES